MLQSRSAVQQGLYPRRVASSTRRKGHRALSQSSALAAALKSARFPQAKSPDQQSRPNVAAGQPLNPDQTWSRPDPAESRLVVLVSHGFLFELGIFERANPHIHFRFYI